MQVPGMCARVIADLLLELLLTRRTTGCRTAFPGMRILLCHYHLKRALHVFLLKKVRHNR